MTPFKIALLQLQATSNPHLNLKKGLEAAEKPRQCRLIWLYFLNFGKWDMKLKVCILRMQ